ncbi:hypothetical protein PspLS_07769 [Pyricularia sp. CBS 133598]|nr:hypothetical protein PspLS_07769 [Pyricularia sp. CBS 133598]
MRLLSPHRDLFPLEQFTIEDSRAMDFVLPDGSSLRLLAPFADMLNHLDSVKQCHAYDASSKTLSVVAGKDYEAGDQRSGAPELAAMALRRIDAAEKISDSNEVEILRFLVESLGDFVDNFGTQLEKI